MASSTDTHSSYAADIHPFWGKLNWNIFPFYEPVIFYTFIVVCILGTAVLAALTYYRLWGYLWR
ncbi:MAG: hypothetical protein AAF865_14590, partial [Pseudomonadota bacterium]